MEKQNPEPRADEILAKRKKDRVERAVRNARIVLFIMSVLTAGSAYFMYNNAVYRSVEMYFAMAEALMFFILAFLTYRLPFAAVLFGLILYVGGQVLMAINHPHTAYKGIIIKVLVVIALADAVIKTKHHHQKKRREDLLDVDI